MSSRDLVVVQFQLSVGRTACRVEVERRPIPASRLVSSLPFLLELLSKYEPHRITGFGQQQRRRGSADWQSAVSRIGNPRAPPVPNTDPTASRRYGRLPTCATVHGKNCRISLANIPAIMWKFRAPGSSGRCSWCRSRWRRGSSRRAGASGKEISGPNAVLR